MTNKIKGTADFFLIC